MILRGRAAGGERADQRPDRVTGHDHGQHLLEVQPYQDQRAADNEARAADNEAEVTEVGRPRRQTATENAAPLGVGESLVLTLRLEIEAAYQI